MPIRDRRYALLERLLGIRGNIASKAKTNTQALIENIMVCRSQRIAVAFGAAPAVVDVPDPDVLLLVPEVRGLAGSLAAVDVDEDDVVCLVG